MTRLRKPTAETVLIINDSKKDSDLFYATRFLVGDPLIYIEHGGRKFLLVSDLEYGRAKKEADVDEVVGAQMSFLAEKDIHDQVALPRSLAAWWTQTLDVVGSRLHHRCTGALPSTGPAGTERNARPDTRE